MLSLWIVKISFIGAKWSDSHGFTGVHYCLKVVEPLVLEISCDLVHKQNQLYKYTRLFGSNLLKLSYNQVFVALHLFDRVHKLEVGVLDHIRLGRKLVVGQLALHLQSNQLFVVFDLDLGLRLQVFAQADVGLSLGVFQSLCIFWLLILSRWVRLQSLIVLVKQPLEVIF